MQSKLKKKPLSESLNYHNIHKLVLNCILIVSIVMALKWFLPRIMLLHF